jgi:predicted PurR-regulated permease PerM
MTQMEKSRNIFYAIVIISLIAGFYFLSHYLSIIAIACLTVILFNPVYKRLTKWLRGRKGLATTFTILFAFLSFVIPMLFVGILSYNQVITVVNDLRDTSLTSNASFQDTLDTTIDRINNVILDLPNGETYTISKDDANRYFTNLVPRVANTAFNFLTRLGGNTASFLTSLILYIVLLASMFPNQERILQFFKRISPLDDRIDNIYLKKMTAMAKSMMKGTFVIALAQGLLGGIFLWIAGVPYTFFFVILLTFLSIIPLGGGIISIPAGIVLLLTGNVWQGLFVIITHFLVITNVDNYLRPKLVSEDARLPSALTLLAIFAGLDVFGWLGFIYGPILMVFIVTTLQIYDKYYSFKAAPLPQKRVSIEDIDG